MEGKIGMVRFNSTDTGRRFELGDVIEIFTDGDSHFAGHFKWNGTKSRSFKECIHGDRGILTEVDISESSGLNVFTVTFLDGYMFRIREDSLAGSCKNLSLDT